MGKPTGFMDYKREECLSEAPLKRIKHFKEFHIHLPLPPLPPDSVHVSWLPFRHTTPQ